MNGPPTDRWLRCHADSIILVAAAALAVALFAPFIVVGDGTFYYDLTRRFLGTGGIVYAYQWGTSLWFAPFYGVWHVLGLRATESPPHAQGDAILDPSITIAAIVAAVAAVLVARRVLQLLALPSNALLLLGGFFGTQLWVYGVIIPSYSHAIDALAFSVACFLLVRVWQGASDLVAAFLGATLACLVAIRYANLAALPGLLLPVVLRRERRPLIGVAIGAGAGALLLLLPPLLAGTGFGDSADVRRNGLGPVAVDAGSDLLRNLAIPFKMLLSPERGLFAYAPLCAFAIVGYILAIGRGGRNRVPLVSMGIAGLGILVVYVLVGGDWIGGGYTYGQRFLASLVALVMIGVAELWRRSPRLTAVLVVLGSAWSLFIGINFLYGWQGVTNDTRTATEIVRLYTSGERTPWMLTRLVAFRLRDRF